MRQYKIVAISIAAVLIAVIGFFVIREIAMNNVPHTINKLNATLTDYISSDLEELVLYNNGTTYTFRKKDGKVKSDNGEYVTKRIWYIVGEENVEIDQNVLNTLAIMTANLVATDVIDEDPKDTSKYGITDKSVYVIGTLKNGESYKLILGDMLYDRNGYYLMLDGDKAIYSIPLYTAKAMLITRGNLLDLSIFPGALSDVSSFNLIKNGENQFTIVPDEVYHWIITEPITFKGDISKIDTIINNTFALMVKEYVDVKPSDLTIYGLDKPKYELVIESGDTKTKLLLGKENIKDSSYYAMVEGKEEVFSIDSTTLNFLDTPVLGVISPYIYLPQLKYVSSVDVKVAGRKMLFEKVYLEDVKLNDYRFNGESINDIDQKLETFGQFYFSLLISPMVTAVVPEATITGEPYCGMKFTYDDGNFETLKYYITDYDKTKLYVVRNDVYTGVVTDIEFFDENNGIAAVTDLILSGKIQEDLAKRNAELDKAKDSSDGN